MQAKAPGYTLIEILFVVGIIGMLTAGIMLTFRTATNKIRRYSTDRILDRVEMALSQYNLDVGRYPGKNDGFLNALVARPKNVDPTDYRGPYLDGVKLIYDETGALVINDSWNQPLEYNIPPTHNQQFRYYEVLSHGQDENDPNSYIYRGK